jgi:O-antigen/teichoic acid export membrane protein
VAADLGRRRLMASTARGRRAAHGTIALVLSRGCYFFLGYFVVVVLARSFGPAAYGAYGVIMAVVVWLEQSARMAVPSAATKLLAESEGHGEPVQRSTLALNLVLHVLFFAALWVAAPQLASWFGIEDGAFLIRIAAIDLPLYGVYTALQAIHQGHHRFLRIGVAEAVYALSKLLGVLVIVYLGISLVKAFVVNALTTVIGIAFLLPRTRFWSRKDWLAFVRPIVVIAAPMGLHALAQLLTSSLDLWILQIMLAGAQEATVGLYLAALNIARVPGFALSAVAAVLLPSVSQANALNDRALVERYINQALRFFLMTYLPVLIVLAALSEEVMLLVYGSEFAGGGILLPILVIAHGFWALHAILSSVLIALGRVVTMAWVSAVAIVPACAILAGAIYVQGAVGAAVASAFVPAVLCAIFALLLRAQIGPFLAWRSVARIGLASLLMYGSNVFLAGELVGFIPLLIAAMIGVLIYAAVLFVSGEVGREDLAIVFSRKLGQG